jgi:hypothetical protein
MKNDWFHPNFMELPASRKIAAVVAIVLGLAIPLIFGSCGETPTAPISPTSDTAVSAPHDALYNEHTRIVGTFYEDAYRILKDKNFKTQEELWAQWRKAYKGRGFPKSYKEFDTFTDEVQAHTAFEPIRRLADEALANRWSTDTFIAEASEIEGVTEEMLSILASSYDIAQTNPPLFAWQQAGVIIAADACGMAIGGPGGACVMSAILPASDAARRLYDYFW